MTRGEVRDRADFYYHRPEFEIEAKRIKQTPYQLVKLGTLCDKVTDGTHFTPTYTESGVPFISVKDVREFQISFKDTKFVSEEEHLILSKRCNPKPGDILLTKVGTIGLAAVIPDDAPEFDLFVSVCLLKFKNKQQSNFVCSVLNSPIAQLQFLRELKGIGVPDLHLENIRDILIPLPPLEIQAQLVAEMEAARQQRGDDLARADALLGGVDEWLLAQLGLTPPALDTRSSFAVTLGQARQRFDTDFHHPHFYQLKNLIRSGPHSRLTDLVGFSSETWQIEDYESEIFNYVEISGVDIANGTAHAQETLVVEAPSRARMLVREGDLILSLTRPHHGAIAQIGAELNEDVASTGFAVVREINTKLIDKDYLWCVLRSQLCLRQMFYRSSGGNYPAIIQSELEQILLPLPPLALQQTIAAEVRRRRDEARQLREKAEISWESAKARFEAQLLGGQP